MLYHPGHIESRHGTPVSAAWYKESGCTDKFCKAVATGGYIPCGTSGDALFGVVGQTVTAMTGADTISDGHCCGFVYGSDCVDKVLLLRRWSCCGRISTGTLLDMIKVKGCRKVYNLT